MVSMTVFVRGQNTLVDSSSRRSAVPDEREVCYPQSGSLVLMVLVVLQMEPASNLDLSCTAQLPRHFAETEAKVPSVLKVHGAAFSSGVRATSDHLCTLFRAVLR